MPRFKLLGARQRRATNPALNFCWWVAYLLVGAPVQAGYYIARQVRFNARTSIGASLTGMLTVLYHFASSEGGGDRAARARFFLRSRLFSLQTLFYWWEGLWAEKTDYPSYSLRETIRRRDNYCCQVCGADGRDGAELHVDHIVPRKWGGPNDRDNLRTLCLRCHGLRHLTSFRD